MNGLTSLKLIKVNPTICLHNLYINVQGGFKLSREGMSEEVLSVSVSSV